MPPTHQKPKNPYAKTLQQLSRSNEAQMRLKYEKLLKDIVAHESYIGQMKQIIDKMEQKFKLFMAQPRKPVVTLELNQYDRLLQVETILQIPRETHNMKLKLLPYEEQLIGLYSKKHYYEYYFAYFVKYQTMLRNSIDESIDQISPLSEEELKECDEIIKKINL